MRNIGIVILAAGGSTRMAQPKQLLPYGDSTLLRQACLKALQTGFSPTVVVLGSEQDRCWTEIADLPLQMVANEVWSEGMGKSIQAGINKLVTIEPSLRAVLIMLPDQPLISVSSLIGLSQAWDPPKTLVAATRYGSAGGVPALFDALLFSELLALTGQEGARKVISKHRDQAKLMAVPGAEWDVDTPDDYGRLIQEAFPSDNPASVPSHQSVE